MGFIFNSFRIPYQIIFVPGSAVLGVLLIPKDCGGLSRPRERGVTDAHPLKAEIMGGWPTRPSSDGP
jgi:hypothetical protein